MKGEIIKHIGNCTNRKCACDPLKLPFVDCIDREAFIYDDDKKDKSQPCQLVGKNDKYQIVILNKSKKPFTFVKFDACIINDSGKRCDALVYNDHQFYYVEIKDTTAGGRSKARKRAVLQLQSSLERFEKIDFGNRELFAIVGFSSPKSRIVNTSSDSNKARFKEKYGVKLMEGHAIPLEY